MYFQMEFPASRFFSCIKQDLPDLTPYMTYNLATSFSGGGGEGPRMLTEFTTGKSGEHFASKSLDMSYVSKALKVKTLSFNLNLPIVCKKKNPKEP